MNFHHAIRSSRSLTAALLISLLSLPLLAQQTSIGTLHFRGAYEIPHALKFQDTQVGGLSGIDYDAKSDTYFMICDDRSALHPARYYEAKIRLSTKGIDTVFFTNKVDLLGPDGKTYPPFRTAPTQTIDPEAMRRNPVNGDLVWMSEGERILKSGDTVLVNPSIVITKAGRYTGEFPVPANAHMTKGEQGPRQNGVFEAFCFTDNGRNFWVALEEPLYQDGPRADVGESFSPVRFYRYDAASKLNTAQFVYDLESVAHKPILSSAFRVNGVTDILEAGPGQLLVVERSFSTGRLPCTVKIFLADLQTAEDVSKIDALRNTPVRQIAKQLLLNMDDLGVHVDNVEGITWGPVLPNGNRTLLLITDNNFQSFQKTQIFLFEVANR